MPSQLRRDPVLEGRLEAMIGAHRRPVAAVVVDRGGMSAAWLDADVAADYEIGSVSKGLTGLLYQDAVERGEVTSDTTLGELLVPADSALASVRLGALAGHRSGLPRLPRSAPAIRRTWALFRDGTNPYGETLAERLDQAATVAPGRARPRYSNLGFELLGHAVAAAARPAVRGSCRSSAGRSSPPGWNVPSGQRRGPPAHVTRWVRPARKSEGAVDGRSAGTGRRRPSDDHRYGSPALGSCRPHRSWGPCPRSDRTVHWTGTNRGGMVDHRRRRVTDLVAQRRHGWVPQLGGCRFTERAGGMRPVSNDPIGRPVRLRSAHRRRLTSCPPVRSEIRGRRQGCPG